MTEHNRPRHSKDPAPDPSYDEAYAYPGPEAGAAAGTGASAGAVAGAGATAGAGTAADTAVGADQQPTPNSGPPLRGLAMILTAVAVVLIVWGAWSFFSDDDKDGDSNSEVAATSAPVVAPAPGASSNAGTGAPQTPGSETAPSAAAPSGAAASTPATDSNDTNGGSDAAGAVGGGASAVDKATTRVSVLNNSTSAIAQPAADRLRSGGWSEVGYGNLQGRIDGVSEASRVYYPQGDEQAKAAAQEVAGELGLPAQEANADYYDRFGEAVVRQGGRPDGVVVVLINALP